MIESHRFVPGYCLALIGCLASGSAAQLSIDASIGSSRLPFIPGIGVRLEIDQTVPDVLHIQGRSPGLEIAFDNQVILDNTVPLEPNTISEVSYSRTDFSPSSTQIRWRALAQSQYRMNPSAVSAAAALRLDLVADCPRVVTVNARCVVARASDSPGAQVLNERLSLSVGRENTGGSVRVDAYDDTATTTQWNETFQFELEGATWFEFWLHSRATGDTMTTFVDAEWIIDIEASDCLCTRDFILSAFTPPSSSNGFVFSSNSPASCMGPPTILDRTAESDSCAVASRARLRFL